MQENYISPISERPLTLKHIVTLYRKHISSVVSLNEEPPCKYNSFIYIENGIASVTVGDKVFILESGNLIFIPPTSFYSIRSANDMSVTYIYSSFISESPIFNNIRLSPIQCNSEDFIYLSTALDNSDNALSSFNNNLNNQSSLTKSLYSNLYNINMQIAYNSIELFLLRLTSSGTILPANDSQKQNRHANITASVEEYLRARVRGNISLQETAQYFGYSVSNIQKIFKAVTGQSIIMYFNKLKLEEAKRLIIEGNLSFSQISSYLSFSNPNYFSRIFKTSVGITPTEFAALYKKDSKDKK